MKDQEAKQWYSKIKERAAEKVGSDPLDTESIKEAYRQAIEILEQFKEIGDYLLVLKENNYGV